MFISNGNEKVKCPIFNLPSITTCKANCECHKYCYARKAEKLYPQVRPCREKNYKETLNTKWVSVMVELIKAKKSEYFRIHESGDFYSVEYIKQWFTVCQALPQKQFYAYTKRDDLFTLELLSQKPKNLVLIYSFDGLKSGKVSDFKIPQGFDKAAITHETKSNCPALNKDVKCMKDCFKCATKKQEIIVFKKH